MGAPRMVKEVQRLTGRIATLNQFISKLAKRCLPFFQILKKPKDFQWTDKCYKVLEVLKVYHRALLLSKPETGEELYI